MGQDRSVRNQRKSVTQRSNLQDRAGSPAKLVEIRRLRAGKEGAVAPAQPRCLPASRHDSEHPIRGKAPRIRPSAPHDFQPQIRGAGGSRHNGILVSESSKWSGVVAFNRPDESQMPAPFNCISIARIRACAVRNGARDRSDRARVEAPEATRFLGPDHAINDSIESCRIR